MNELHAATPFFSGDNVTFMIVVATIAVSGLMLFLLSELFSHGREPKDITVEQIKADANIKIAKLEADADIKVAEFEAMAVTRKAELESGASSIETASKS